MYEVQHDTSLCNQFLFVAAGLSVVSLLHVVHVVQQSRPSRFIRRHLKGHLFEHLRHWHLQQTQGRWLRVTYNVQSVSSHIDIMWIIIPLGSEVSRTWRCWLCCPARFSLETFLCRVWWFLVEENTLITTIHRSLMSNLCCSFSSLSRPDSDVTVSWSKKLKCSGVKLLFSFWLVSFTSF